MAIQILLIDDHAIFRETAARALSAEPDMDVVGQAESVGGALDLLGSVSPEVILLDYDLHGRSGIEFVAAARRRGFGGRILIVSAGIPEGDLNEALREGASGLVLKEESLARLLAAIRAVVEGRMWLDDRRVQLLVSSERPASEFTLRERHILTGVVDGLSNKEIADQLRVPETTVKSGLQLLFRKTGVRTRGSLIRVALEKYRRLLLRVGTSGESV